MTQEQKAKAYDEALEDMRVIYPNLKGDAKLAVEHAFPELAESEDERIRKGIVETIKQCPDTFLNPKNRDRMLAWLEKQKENPKNADSIPADCASNARCPYKIHGDEDFIGDIKDTPAYHFGFDEGVRSERERQKEQKPETLTDGTKEYTIREDYTSAYYEERGYARGYNDGIRDSKLVSSKPPQKAAEKQDYSGLNQFERAIHRGFLCAGVENVPVGIIKETAQDCLAHLPVEWSEEDKKMRDSILAELANHICYNKPLDGMPSGTGWTSYKYQQEMDWLTNRLKSIRPGWKPTEEQMNALNFAITYFMHETNYKNPTELRELYDDLLKLK